MLADTSLLEPSKAAGVTSVIHVSKVSHIVQDERITGQAKKAFKMNFVVISLGTTERCQKPPCCENGGVGASGGAVIGVFASCPSMCRRHLYEPTSLSRSVSAPAKYLESVSVTSGS